MNALRDKNGFAIENTDLATGRIDIDGILANFIAITQTVDCSVLDTEFRFQTGKKSINAFDFLLREIARFVIRRNV
jgi:hypothetical protein